MGRPILITAGATRNPLDQMRFISANSSGKTGAALALALCEEHAVHVLGHPETLLRLELGLLNHGGTAPSPATLSQELYGSTSDLLQRMQRWVHGNPRGLVVHAAAVGDYKAQPLAGKVSSGRQDWVVPLRPTPKIADQVRRWSSKALLVSFKAAPPGTPDGELVRVAQRQLVRTGSALVFANVIGQLGSGIALVEEQRVRRFGERSEALNALIRWLGAQAA